MRAIFFTVCMAALWIVDLFNETGLGMTYHTTEIAIGATVVIAIICLASQSLHEGDVFIKPKYFYTIFPLAILGLGVLLLSGKSPTLMRLFWPYLLVYIFSKTRPSHTALRMTALSYAVMGLIVLVVFNFTDFFKGWNPNKIGMLGMASFLGFTIPFIGMREWRSFIVMPVIGTAYAILIWPTESRSCCLMIVLQILIVLSFIPLKQVLKKKTGRIFLLLVPLIVSIAAILLASFGDISGLTEWSYEKFNKPLFNGRDQIWLSGYKIWKDHLLFGNANLNTGYWHNSAVACLTSFGTVGFVLWICLFYFCVDEGTEYLDDICVYGSIAAFIVYYCQQSVEIGLFSVKPSVLPYVMLGVYLGRVNRLKEERKRATGQYSNSRL